jgi:starch phosphorylase
LQAMTLRPSPTGSMPPAWLPRRFENSYRNRHIPLWRKDNFSLRYALSVPRDQLWNAHHAVQEAAHGLGQPRNRGGHG